MKFNRCALGAALACLTLLFLSGTAGADCFTVLVGKNASTDGSVLFGHNEQNGGRRIVNYRYIPRMQYPPGTLIKLKNGGILDQVDETWALLWLENPGVEFGDAYFNEWGVVIASDSCGTREDPYAELAARGDITDGGIGYMLRRIVAQRARTAREGVEIMGALLNRFGYSSSGRSYTIADPDEGWVVAVAAGKRWIAERCPDDAVVLLPNVHILDASADLSDTKNVIASPGLVEYAAKRGWYDQAAGKPFSFREAFNHPARPGQFMDKYGVDPLQWFAQSKVIGRMIELPAKQQLPFSVKPTKKMSVADVAAILRSHNEGTEFDDTEGYKKGSPHRNRFPVADICGPTTQEGAVYQLRAGMPREIGCLVWRTTAAPCSNVMTPWYLGITSTPEAYHKPGDIEDILTLEHHFQPPAGTFEFDAEFAFDICNELENLVDTRYAQAIEVVREEWDPFEREQFDLQAAVEKTALDLYRKDKELCRKYLTAYTHSRALLALDKAKRLKQSLKTRFWAF